VVETAKEWNRRGLEPAQVDGGEPWTGLGGTCMHSWSSADDSRDEAWLARYAW
jgi:hypothetical protein